MKRFQPKEGISRDLYDEAVMAERGQGYFDREDPENKDPLHNFIPVEDIPSEADDPEEALIRREIEDDEDGDDYEDDKKYRYVSGLEGGASEVGDIEEILPQNEFEDDGQESGSLASNYWHVQKAGIRRKFGLNDTGLPAFFYRLRTKAGNDKDHVPLEKRLQRRKRDIAEPPEYALGDVRLRRESSREVLPELSASEKFAMFGFASVDANDVWQRHAKSSKEDQERFELLQKKLGAWSSRQDVLFAKKDENSPTAEECIKHIVLLTDDFCKKHPELRKDGTDKDAPGMEILFGMLNSYDYAYQVGGADRIRQSSPDDLLRILRDALSKAVSWAVKEPGNRVDWKTKLAFDAFIRKASAMADKIPYSLKEAYAA